MARRRFQKDQLFKSGKRRKMWVGRWREDVLVKSGAIGRMRRWQVLGSVADTSDAGARRRLCWMNGCGLRIKVRPARAAFVTFGAFVEEQWKPLVLPTFKASTQHGYKTVLRNACAAALAGLAASRHRAARDSAVGRRQVPAGHRLAVGSQCVGAAVRHSRDGGRVRVSPDEPGAGREVPAEGAEGEARDDRRRQLREAARAGQRTASDDGAVSSRRRDCGSASCWRCGGRRSISRVAR